jgi:signal transduction histidine kinase
MRRPHLPLAPRSLSLRARLSLAFGGIAILTAGLIGAVLIPVLAGHYRGAERTYLDAAAERAVRDLGAFNWKKYPDQLPSTVTNLALVTQTRVRVTNNAGAVLADSGSPGSHAGASPETPLPDPLGGGLFGSDSAKSGAQRSDQQVERPVQTKDQTQGSVQLSEGPAYARAALLNTVKAWGLAALLGVLIAALVGWLVAWRLSRPLLVLTEASDQMARGDLSVRTNVTRGDEVGRLASSFDSMAARVEGTVVTLRRFVADAAHEIGTPLTALQADLEIAQTHPESSVRKRFLAQAAGQVERLERLASSLLRLSRLEAGYPSEKPMPLELNALIHRAVDAVASRAEQADIELSLDLAGQEVWITGYEDKLENALGNLLDNALKFTPREGTISVGLRAQSRQARLWVSDTGIGIPKDELPGLFERFRRGRAVSTVPGSGLGLAIVKATAELHGGSIAASSDGARGALFELTLPLASDR